MLIFCSSLSPTQDYFDYFSKGDCFCLGQLLSCKSVMTIMAVTAQGQGRYARTVATRQDHGHGPNNNNIKNSKNNNNKEQTLAKNIKNRNNDITTTTQGW